MQRLLDPNSYCLFWTIPKEYWIKADMGIASFIGSAFLWAPYVNDTLTTAGLGLGVFIGAVRAWKAWKYRKYKDY